MLLCLLRRFSILRAGGTAQVVEYLPTEVQDPYFKTQYKKKRKKEERRKKNVSVSLVAQATGIAQALDCLAGVRP
jgi:hypothetical protein